MGLGVMEDNGGRREMCNHQEQHKDPRHGLLGRYQVLKQRRRKLHRFRTSERFQRKEEIRRLTLAMKFGYRLVSPSLAGTPWISLSEHLEE